MVYCYTPLYQVCSHASKFSAGSARHLHGLFKAFDTILLTKLATIDIPSLTVPAAFFYGSTSCSFLPSRSVPQGFILDPLLFLSYINESQSIACFTPIALIFSWVALPIARVSLQWKLGNLVRSFSINKLALNIIKCHSRCYSLKTNPTLFPTFLTATLYYIGASSKTLA